MGDGSLQIQWNQNPNPRLASEGWSVLLDINDGDRLVFARLSPSSTLKIGNKNCSLRPLIGCPFGSLFQVEIGPKGPFLSRVYTDTEVNIKEKDDSQLKDGIKDNRALLDNNSAQNLSGEDIDAMRREGATGDQIIEALIANSSTFEKKTSFSQEKYKLRKQKKYAPRVLMRRPFARSICEAYFKKYPARIGFLRVDALSLLLSLANVSAYSDVLVVDKVGGLITGAVAERLGGTGFVCNTYLGIIPYPMDIVRMFNFSDSICTRIVQCPLSDLCSARKSNTEPLRSNHKACSSELQSNTDENASSIIECHSLQEDPPHSYHESGGTSPDNVAPASMDLSPEQLGDVDASSLQKTGKLAKPGKPPSPEAIELWKENGFTSLIIAAPELDTWSVVQEVLPLVSYSAPFAIYHQYLQPLAICMHNLQASKMAIGLQICEPWLREYQVLPSRTHPFMQMSAFGGYILSGIRICNEEASQQNKKMEENNPH